METEKADHSPSARRLAELELRFELERKHTQSRHKLIESGLEIERIYSFLLQELMQIDEDKMREMTNRVSRLEKGAMKCQEETVSPHRAQPVAVNSVHKVPLPELTAAQSHVTSVAQGSDSVSGSKFSSPQHGELKRDSVVSTTSELDSGRLSPEIPLQDPLLNTKDSSRCTTVPKPAGVKLPKKLKNFTLMVSKCQRSGICGSSSESDDKEFSTWQQKVNSRLAKVDVVPKTSESDGGCTNDIVAVTTSESDDGSISPEIPLQDNSMDFDEPLLHLKPRRKFNRIFILDHSDDETLHETPRKLTVTHDHGQHCQKFSLDKLDFVQSSHLNVHRQEELNSPAEIAGQCLTRSQLSASNDASKLKANEHSLSSTSSKLHEPSVEKKRLRNGKCVAGGEVTRRRKGRTKIPVPIDIQQPAHLSHPRRSKRLVSCEGDEETVECDNKDEEENATITTTHTIFPPQDQVKQHKQKVGNERKTKIQNRMAVEKKEKEELKEEKEEEKEEEEEEKEEEEKEKEEAKEEEEEMEEMKSKPADAHLSLWSQMPFPDKHGAKNTSQECLENDKRGVVRKLSARNAQSSSHHQKSERLLRKDTRKKDAKDGKENTVKDHTDSTSNSSEEGRPQRMRKKVQVHEDLEHWEEEEDEESLELTDADTSWKVPSKKSKMRLPKRKMAKKKKVDGDVHTEREQVPEKTKESDSAKTRETNGVEEADRYMNKRLRTRRSRDKDQELPSDAVAMQKKKVDQEVEHLPVPKPVGSSELTHQTETINEDRHKPQLRPPAHPPTRFTKTTAPGSHVNSTFLNSLDNTTISSLSFVKRKRTLLSSRASCSTVLMDSMMSVMDDTVTESKARKLALKVNTRSFIAPKLKMSNKASDRSGHTNF